MPTLRIAAILGAFATPALLGVIATTSGLGVAGWLVGLLAGWLATAGLIVARHRSERPAFLPADWVTLIRALLAAGVAGLVADAFTHSVSTTALVTLSVIALALDGVDGQLARRTGTATALGGRLDGEVDAALILLLSIAVYLHYGTLTAWVLVIGAARYLLLIAGWVRPWLAAPLPPRYWRKVVAAAQGITLTFALADVVNAFIGLIVVGGALVLLLESFGRDLVWLFRRGASPVTQRVVRISTAVASVAIVWAALVVPDRLSELRPTAFLRIPIEALVLVAVALLLPARARRVLAAIVGVLIGLLTFVKVLDIGFFVELDRAFDPVLDWSNLQPAIGVVEDSIGQRATDLFLVLLALAAALILTVIAAATVRVCTLAAGVPRRSVATLATLGGVWALSAALTLQLVPGAPVASSTTAGIADTQVRDATAAFHDQQQFETAIHSTDPESQIPSANLLTGLRGKDVLFVFIESYGQVADQGSTFAPGVDAALRQGNATLAQAGFSSRSAWLTSPTFGGISWLAHSTLQSGLTVNSQQRYNQLVVSNRFTLSDAFKKAGWETVSDDPSDTLPWPQGTSFYHYDRQLNQKNVGYQGPKFSYAQIPDQYTYDQFGKRVLTPGHKPVMAEIDTVSSHEPWTPLPHMVPWNQLGNGSIYDPMPAQGLTPATAFQHDATVQRLYGQSIQYSIQALTQWIARINDPNLVLLVMGDHEPAEVVSGNDPTHNVPVSIIAHDPSVLQQVSSWHWTSGLQPSPSAPTELMGAVRNQFLGTFDSQPAAAVHAAAAAANPPAKH